MGAFKIAKTVLRSMFNKPATLMYPVVEREYPERTRGSVDIDTESCILCGLCSRRCPAKAIETKRNTGEWIIHRMRCIQCGECIEVCPKDCLEKNSKYTEPGSEKIVDVYDIASVRKDSAAVAGAGIQEKLVCDLEDCVYCGLCARNCPVDALKVDRKEKLWEVDEEACVKCGACIDKCPKKCLDFENTEKDPAEKHAARSDDERLLCDLEECIFCGLCAKNCPCDALTVDRKAKLWEVDEEACVKCEACINKCPKECLSIGLPEDEVVSEEGSAEEGTADEAVTEETAVENVTEETAAEEAAVDQRPDEEAGSEETEPEEPAPDEETPEQEQEKKSVPVLDEDKCIYCRLCENTCPEEAILAEMDDWRLDRDRCISCGQCIGVCPAEALKMSD